ncbi:unnamed protein product [Victoria cruziana]
MKILQRLLPCMQNRARLLYSSSLSTGPVLSAQNFTHVQGFSSIAGTELTSVGKMVTLDEYPGVSKGGLGRISNACQTRSFLGCVDGEEGDILSKNYEERRIIGYSPEQLFAVVAAVDLYQDFVPWCQRSKIIRHNSDGSVDAELQIGFKFFVESYMSHVEMKKPRRIKTTASESGLFDHLINVWEFDPGPVPGSCNLHFLVDFRFQSPLYRQV